MALIFGSTFYAQNYNLTNTFTTKDGLPSNLVYEAIQDNSGFLWVATDNGISRFDGKRFINYSTKNGLPSNDVIRIIKQKDGTIWANCYKQPPSYFDEKLNRFICIDTNLFVREMSNVFTNVIYSVRGDDLFFHNYFGSFIYSKGKITHQLKYGKENNPHNINIYFKDELISTRNTEKTEKDKKYIIKSFFKNNVYLGQIKFLKEDTFINESYDNNTLYEFERNKITQVKIISLSPFKYELKTIAIPGSLKWYTFSDSKLNITCTDGTILIYDENSLELLSTIKNTFNVNTAYVDHKNNVWVATINNGLMYYTNQTIKKENYSPNTISNFLCAKIDDNGDLYAGNYQGEIYVKKGNKEIKYNFSTLKENNLWIRNIHFFAKKVIVVSDEGILVNFDKKLIYCNEAKAQINFKSSCKLNETDLILGSIQGLVKFNIESEKFEVLNFPKQRILNLKRIRDTLFYFSADDGLYQYDVRSNTYELIISNNLLKNDKIQYFEVSSNSKIWVSTYRGNLYLIKNKNVEKSFVNDVRLPINISKLLNIGQELYIASKSGIFTLDYSNLNNISISKLTTADGLTSNVVNFLDYKKDTIYAATDHGVSKIPFQNTKTSYFIKPQLIAVKINENAVPVQKIYQLKSNQNNISLELAAVDLTGHFKNFQYQINKGQFSDIEGNFLNLQLNNGENSIVIRLVDENNIVHDNAIKLIFEIETPFYKAIWFWALISILFTALLFYFYNQRKLALQKRNFRNKLELEKQRNKITADLHDDLGASLSSLQINSAVAQKLMDKNPVEAKKILRKIESQAKNISENIGDIIWSLKPHKDEFMSLSTRIKKITSEILGSSNIKYKIKIDDSINEEISDFSARKNIILICKEALNNILKHSNSTKAEVTIAKMETHFILKISDDGTGFTSPENNGNGLSNIKKRAAELGAKIEIEEKGGISIIIHIPRIRE